MNALKNLSLGQKIMMMAAMLLLPSLVLLWQTMWLQNKAIDTTELELQGVEYAHAVENAVIPIADHRGLADLYQQGDLSRANAITAAAAKATAAMTRLAKLEPTIDARLQSGAQWRAAFVEWQELKQQVLTLPQQESDRRHTALLEKLGALTARMVDRSMLIVDSEATSRHLMDAAIIQVPQIQMDLFALRGALSAIVGLDKLPHAVRGDLAAKSSAVNRNVESLSSVIATIAALRPEASGAMNDALNVHATAAATFAGIVEDELILTDKPQATAGEAFTLGTKAYETADQLHGVLVPLLQQELQTRLNAAVRMRNFSLLGGIVLLVIAILLGRTARLHITGAVQNIVVAIQRIADGDVGRQIPVNSSDELGQVVIATNRLDAKLVEVVAVIKSSANDVDSAAKELTMGNDNLSSRTQQLAASIEETASSMEQMTATVKQNADNAMQANRLVTGARQQAERGGAVVQRAVGAMVEINSSSRKIADIIGVIDEIAFQTNLLALNAAVEAARAGEQGRGFAVVASEVRNLAQRSASAAKEIKALINDSVDKVKSGEQLVNESGKTLAEIMDTVKKVADIVADIAAASGEQSSGIEQVNQAITLMDNGTQENAALVEESAAVSKAIHGTVTRLVDEIAFFKVEGQSSGQYSAASAGTVRTFTGKSTPTSRRAVNSDGATRADAA